MIRGSANGSRVRLCISTPATASAAPAATPRIVLGIRWVRTIKVCAESSGLKTARHTSPNGIPRLPTARLSGRHRKSFGGFGGQCQLA
jgi:hypothetical protein